MSTIPFCELAGQLFGQFQFRESGNLGDDPHYDRVAPTLRKYVDAKAAFAGQAVRNIARASFSQHRQRLLVSADEFLGDTAGVFRAKRQ